MDLVFSTDQYAAADRYDAWRGAICDVYVHVDVKAVSPDRYRGFIREAKFGEVVLTDILLSEQRIRRNNQHIAQLDKECYYIQFVQRGNISVLQSGETHRSNPARGAIFSAADQYELHAHGDLRSLYLELPRDDFARRFPRERIPIAASINTTQGLGRITSDFCAALATESAKVEGDSRVQLGSQLMDMLALTLLAAENDTPGLDSSVQQARLRSVQQWIDAHIRDADLSLERIAGANGMSLRYLHRLFERCEMSVSEWIWHRRLQLSYDEIAKADGRSITEIAFDHGFSSSAHFSTMFRRRYGITPRDVARRPS
jgi:AraC-like DNA-binding protein